jgi:hypothetical protein
MNPLMGGDDGINLFSIILNIVFGFIGGLMIFIGATEVIAYGSTLAEQLIKVSGYGKQMASFGFATSAAPYVVLAPIGGLVVRQLTSIRTLKSFAFFAGAVLLGLALAYVSKGYVLTAMH